MSSSAATGAFERKRSRTGYENSKTPAARISRSTSRPRAVSLANPTHAASTDGIIAQACRAAGFDPQLVSLTRDQLAIRSLISRGLAVTLAPALLAEAFAGTALRPINGPAHYRDVYALIPEGERHPLARPMLAALQETARALDRADGVSASP
jgi:DNA-binding transcriptional LysR family regulator